MYFESLRQLSMKTKTTEKLWLGWLSKTEEFSLIPIHIHSSVGIRVNPKLFAMAETLMLFRFIRNSYQLLDIDLEQSRPNRQFNWKIFLALLCMILMFIASWAFVQFEAETIEDFANCFTGLFMIFFLLIFFIINLLKMPKIFNLIEMMEKFIELSKCGLNFLAVLFHVFSPLSTSCSMEIKGLKNTIQERTHTTNWMKKSKNTPSGRISVWWI